MIFFNINFIYKKIYLVSLIYIFGYEIEFEKVIN